KKKKKKKKKKVDFALQCNSPKRSKRQESKTPKGFLQWLKRSDKKQSEVKKGIGSYANYHDDNEVGYGLFKSKSVSSALVSRSSGRGLFRNDYERENDGMNEKQKEEYGSNYNVNIHAHSKDGVPIEVFGLFVDYFNSLLEYVVLPEIAPYYFRTDPTLIFGMIPTTKAIDYVSGKVNPKKKKKKI
ncbi:hypothetical protein RFI_33643, partial [Reticulomyxa filosa]